jgi:hypothetical protein
MAAAPGGGGSAEQRQLWRGCASLVGVEGGGCGGGSGSGKEAAHGGAVGVVPFGLY